MMAGAAGATGNVWSAVFYYPLAVADRAISVGKLCLASKAIEIAGTVLTEILFTLRHTATAATDVAAEAGQAVRYGFAFQAAARVTAMMAGSTKYIPFLLM